MQRSRSALRSPDAPGELLGDIPAPESQAERPSPRALLEEVRSPGVARAEVDALLSGLESPLGPGESARERADLVHEILEDERIRDYTGSGGRKVEHVAVLQLGELGFPYALEVPPELYAEARAAAGHGEVRPWQGGSRRTWGLGVTALAGGLEALPALFALVEGHSSDVGLSLGWLLVVALTSFVPALLAGSEAVSSTPWLRALLKLAVALPALPWLAGAALVVAVSIAGGAFPWALLAALPAGMGLLHLGGARMLYGPPPGEELLKPREE
ncbi:MAG TPA: hypothetical protein VFZ09_24635 [Archangium sp.]|uniref:hypothetical protein n=1 Tax=Archangium sp. TaxID=1872627 RepID=UPI002E376BD1|nr:hypothetical protein [Archangium sp.]HEX5749439.1 hypothetical protein [Archangium sp.]